MTATAEACAQRLEWDSAFFGLRIGTVTVPRLTPPIIADVMRAAEAWHLDCLYYAADCHDRPSVELAERHGFHFVDIRLTFEHDLKQGIPSGLGAPGILIRAARPEDAEPLAEIGRTSYQLSRYYFDARFPRDRVEAFYTEWVAKSCRGYAGHVVVAAVDGRPVGYVTCQMRSPILGAIELVGIDESARGRGIGRLMLRDGLDWFATQGAKSVEVVTQGRNYAAQRLYQRAGFVTKTTQLWYHKWFDREAAKT